MAKIKINVTEHLLTVTELPMISAHSVNIDEIEAEFDETWNGFAKIAILKKSTWKTTAFTVFDCNNIAKIPDSVDSGNITLGIVGINSDSQITTNIKTISIEDSAEFDGIEAPEEDVYRQILDSYARVMKTFDEKINGIEEMTNNVASLRRYMNFKKVDSFTDSFGNVSVGYKCGNIVVYYIDYFSTSPVSDTNTNVGVVIHTIPETVGTPIINAREASDLSVTIRSGESYVRKVCPDSVIKITKGSREIRLITASTTTRMTVWFLVEPEETGVDIHTHIVDTLPTEGVETNSIYFLETNANSNSDKYEEYVYINGEWERIGGSAYLDTNINSYSTEERVVGTWLDGKPLYQKTIKFSTPINVDVNNAATVVDMRDFQELKYISVICSAALIREQGTYKAAVVMCAARKNTDTELVVYGYGSTEWTSMEYITLQYTKNSDNTIGSMENPYSYSIDEKIIGNWIDGNLLYQKTVYIDSLPNNSTKNIAHGISKISSIIGIDSYVIWSSGWTADLPWVVAGDDSETITVSAGLSNIQIVTKKDRTSMSAYVTLRYTKTS